MTGKVGFGIIGAGMIAELHGRTIRELDSTELIGFYDTNFEAAQKRAAQFDCRAYASFEEFLADPAIEAVT
ncbi:MAG: Gfo/Idh/MocA family oxidoreductase, partial [Lentisphaeria bacterium]|nr:Gfo/Idh/MocA family oxidoreductase [Lentisphaeria bacterium]